jgi:glycosyltransferase involved in cell wall biosynthesis
MNQQNSFKIIVPFYNASEFLERCVNSIITQKYDNYKVIFIDDASTDNSWEMLPHNNDKAICIKNKKNVTALPNIHNAIMEHCEKEDIVVLVDGDDWLINKKVLSYLNEFYHEHDCWITYGQASWTDGRRGFASAYPKEEFQHLRKAPFRVSHLRTFKAGLYQKIKEYDDNFSCLKDKNKEFYKMTYDVAIMLPIMEMAGFERVKYNDKVLYIYNRDNPISDDKVNQQLQWDIHAEINKKPSFKKIENYE